MKKIMAIGLLCSLKAFAAPPATCADFSGNYLMPSSAQEQVEHITNLLMIDQTKCLGWEMTIGSPGFIPITPGTVFGQDSGGYKYSIVGNTVVAQADSGGDLLFFSYTHGQCLTSRFVMALDANNNMNITAAKIHSCEDKYVGAGSEVYPRQ